MNNFKSSLKKLIKKDSSLTVITSVMCAIFGLLVGFVVLFIINPGASFEGFKTLSLGFLACPSSKLMIKTLARELTRTAPLITAGLAILFAYKAGLFNIGASGQYTMAILVTYLSASLLHLPWWLCIILAIIAGALYGSIVGILKAYLNVNEVISGIMLNWIALYFTNMIIKGNSTIWDGVKFETYPINTRSAGSLLPTLGLDKIFNYDYITIAVFIAPIVVVAIYFILNKTTFGYELKATGANKNAAKYAGMKEKRNTILTLAISGGLIGLSAPLLYLTGIENWTCPTSVPSMGFDGISAAFLGGLNPIGTIISSFFISHITIGGSRLNTDFYSSEISSIVTAVIIYLCAFVLFFKTYLHKRINKREKLESSKTKEEIQIIDEENKKQENASNIEETKTEEVSK